MELPNISRDTTLDAIWEDLSYTEARLYADLDACDLAGQLSEVLDRIVEVKSGQWDRARDEVVAEAGVESLRQQLDEAISGFATELSALPSHPGKLDPHDLAPLRLEAKLRRIRPFLDVLSDQEELAASIEGLRRLVRESEDVLFQRETATRDRVRYRLEEVYALLEEINDLRQGLFHELARRAQRRALPESWATAFFRTATPLLAAREAA